MTPAAYLDRHSSELLAFLRDIVRIPTVNPPGVDYDKVTARLVKELTATGLEAKRWNVPKAMAERVLPAELRSYPRYNVLGFWPVGAKKTIHFNAHYDVVPVSGNWTHQDPFGGQVDAGWIYGRGTADMKGSIASLIFALKALRDTRAQPLMNIEVSFTADEETDSLLGSGWVVEHAPIKPDYAVVMEGGEGNAICCGHNGVVWLKVTVHGKAAHGSRPDRGINALEKMSALVLALDDYKRILAERTFTTPEGTTMRPTLNIGGVFESGPGGKINTVPAEASFSIDRRVMANESLAKAEQELRAFLKSAAKKIPQCRITIEKVSDNHPCFAPPTDPFFGSMKDAVVKIRRRPAVFNVSTGFNDMHFFSYYRKIPTLGYGPGGEKYHAIDERARVKDLIQCAKIYTELLLNFAG